jgi:uncharacterized protein
MRLTVLRRVLLIMLAGMASPGCAKEDLLMDKVDVHDVFADARVAELADAIVDDDTKRVHALAKSTDLRAHGDKNVTLLEWAVFNKSRAAFKALLAEGADPALPGIDGSTAAHLAAMINDPYYLDELLKAGVNPSLRDKASGQPLLSAALMGRRDDQFRALLAAGADPNGTDDTGDTPLHVAGLINDPEHALTLLQAGTDPNTRNGQGVTFQRYLFKTKEKLLNEKARHGRDSVRTWLREHGIEVEDTNS